ncbi:MAG: DNA (cytosine-5-)-methyltransferase [Chloroflexota bacterium]
MTQLIFWHSIGPVVRYLWIMLTNSPLFSDLRTQAGLSIQEVADTVNRPLALVEAWDHGHKHPHHQIMGLLHHAATRVAESANRPEKFRFIDLFAGIGGMRRGFESVGGKCVFTSEWNPFARQTYAANFACNHPFSADITKVDVNDIPAHDLLVAGFPCQPFSIAGVSKKNALGRPHGFSDATQGTLFFDIARILDHHKPAAFLLENVKNLESHDKGRTFKVILETLSGLGYSVQWRVINGKGIVPQNRERVFLAGFRDKTEFDFSALSVPATKSGPSMDAVLHPEDGSEAAEPPYTAGNLAKVDQKYTLSLKLWNYLQDYAAKHQARGNGFGYGLVTSKDSARTLSARYFKDGSEILVDQPNHRPRRLTPRECARLMGFDALWGDGAQSNQRPMVIPVSDTQAYKQFGNAVIVPVVEIVAAHLAPFI